MRTKIDIINDRREMLLAEIQKLDAEVVFYKNKRFDGQCSHCGKPLVTEYDYAAHFVIPNESYKNVVECPKKMLNMLY